MSYYKIQLTKLYKFIYFYKIKQDNQKYMVVIESYKNDKLVLNDLGEKITDIQNINYVQTNGTRIIDEQEIKRLDKKKFLMSI